MKIATDTTQPITIITQLTFNSSAPTFRPEINDMNMGAITISLDAYPNVFLLLRIFIALTLPSAEQAR